MNRERIWYEACVSWKCKKFKSYDEATRFADIVSKKRRVLVRIYKVVDGEPKFELEVSYECREGDGCGWWYGYPVEGHDWLHYIFYRDPRP